MNALRLVLRGLVHFRRTHAGVALGVVVATATLVGALLVGDSVRASLLERSLQRIGRVDASLGGSDRMLREELGRELEAELASRLAGRAGSGVRVAPVLRVDGVGSAEGGARRANSLAVHGVDARFFALSPGGVGPRQPGRGECYLSAAVAEQLGVVVGDEFLLRVEQPSALSRDMILAPTEDTTVSSRVEVIGILAPEEFARFALVATPLPAANVFCDLSWLQERLLLEGRANLFLLAGGEGARRPSERGSAALSSAELARAADEALGASWTLDDLELLLEPVGDGSYHELSSPRVFLEDPIPAAAGRSGVPVLALATYFVNSLASERGSTPYSMVCALGGLTEDASFAEYEPLVAGPGELVAVDWLAADQQLEVGEELTLEYYVPGADRRLRTETSVHRLQRIVPLEGIAADPSLMPAFPGLEDSENCRDWETGVPVDLDVIRDKDEQYWDDHEGTPKAYIDLATARERWGSRFGSLTALRVRSTDVAALRAGLAGELNPRELGLYFQDVRDPALARGNTPTDFGGLFIGLSFFLIAGALILVAMLFALGVEQRSQEVGLLLAVGFTAPRIRRSLLGEAAGVAVLGVLLGVPLGVVYTRVLLGGLGSTWAGAVAGTELHFHLLPGTVAIGAGAALLSGLAAAWLVLRRQVRRPAAELLRVRDGVAPEGAGPGRSRLALLTVVAGLPGMAAMLLLAPDGGGPAAAGFFFGAGSLALLVGIAASRLFLARAQAASVRHDLGGPGSLGSLGSLGRRNAARRPGRSTATIALLASGAFLVLSIGVNHRSGTPDPLARDSGTGGFALYGSATLPIHDELDEAQVRDGLALDPEVLEGVSFVPLRIRPGDDASCLNLGAPQNPRLVGVRAEQLLERGAFSFAKIDPDLELDGGTSPWSLLGRTLPDGSVAAIADQASVQWTLKKAVGDTLEYQDGRGEVFQVRLVATLSDSILQGDLLIAEEDFQRHYPGEDGFRGMLVDAPPGDLPRLARELGSALADAGLELVPTERRLEQFQAVQNTYLAIFQVLGALGVLLGSIGLGAIVLRNALERRSELSLLAAVGYRRGQVRLLLFREHVDLLVLGLGTGGLAALVALWPASSSGTDPGLLWVLAGALVVNGLFWVGLAAFGAVRGELLAGLRDE